MSVLTYSKPRVKVCCRGSWRAIASL